MCFLELKPAFSISLINFGVAQKEIVSGLAKLSFIWELVSCVGNFKSIKDDVSKYLK